MWGVHTSALPGGIERGKGSACRIPPRYVISRDYRNCGGGTQQGKAEGHRKKKAPGATAQGMGELDSLVSRVHHNSA